MTFLTDAKGSVTDTYTYDAWGNVIGRTGDTQNGYLFQGQRWDADLGLFFLRARHYDPGRGRFMTTDSVQGRLEEPISLNKYLYGHADPVNRSDPSGAAAP